MGTGLPLNSPCCIWSDHLRQHILQKASQDGTASNKWPRAQDGNRQQRAQKGNVLNCDISLHLFYRMLYMKWTAVLNYDHNMCCLNGSDTVKQSEIVTLHYSTSA